MYFLAKNIHIYWLLSYFSSPTPLLLGAVYSELLSSYLHEFEYPQIHRSSFFGASRKTLGVLLWHHQPTYPMSTRTRSRTHSDESENKSKVKTVRLVTFQQPVAPPEWAAHKGYFVLAQASRPTTVNPSVADCRT